MPPTNAERFAPGLFLGELAQLSENLTKPPAESSPEVSIKAPPRGLPEVPSKSNGTTVNGTAANGAVAASAPVVAAKATLDHAAECDPPVSEGPFSLLDPYCSREYREQFRLLRTQLMLHRSRFPQERDFQIVCVMSTHKGEGKSFTASNLAAVLAANGEKVLLIDADPRSKPTPIGLKLSEDAGLPNALATPAEWMKDVHRVKGTSLYVMARGTEKASHELKPTLPSRSWRELNLARLPDLLEAVRPHFDWIIVDGAAFAVCPDAPWLTSVTDGTLLVISENSSGFCAVQESLASIPPERFVGVVFNKRTRQSGFKLRLRIRVGRRRA
jgi:protein-tyrosine kinase